MRLRAREAVAKYYEGSLVSDDELMPVNTRNVCLRAQVRPHFCQYRAIRHVKAVCLDEHGGANLQLPSRGSFLAEALHSSLAAAMPAIAPGRASSCHACLLHPYLPINPLLFCCENERTPWLF